MSRRKGLHDRVRFLNEHILQLLVTDSLVAVDVCQESVRKRIFFPSSLFLEESPVFLDPVFDEW